MLVRGNNILMWYTESKEKMVRGRTAKSSKERYFPLLTLCDMVPRSIGRLTTSEYPGTFSDLTGCKKKA